jgi:hypothetical protein
MTAVLDVRVCATSTTPDHELPKLDRAQLHIEGLLR